ncbi:MAG: hypothetical protein K2Q01_02645 [Rickettsiales bacterium]|nr:hypothetical protein [Rickettsiales bacterium]
MRTLSLLLVTASALAFTAPAFAADEKIESKVTIEKDDDGEYKETAKTSHTDTAGTKTTSERKVEVDVSDDGSVEKTVKTKQVTDPKGLMNKDTEKSKTVEKTSADGTVETSTKKTMNGKTVEDSSTKH